MEELIVKKTLYLWCQEASIKRCPRDLEHEVAKFLELADIRVLGKAYKVLPSILIPIQKGDNPFLTEFLRKIDPENRLLQRPLSEAAKVCQEREKYNYLILPPNSNLNAYWGHDGDGYFYYSGYINGIRWIEVRIGTRFLRMTYEIGLADPNQTWPSLETKKVPPFNHIPKKFTKKLQNAFENLVQLVFSDTALFGYVNPGSHTPFLNHTKLGDPEPFLSTLREMQKENPDYFSLVINSNSYYQEILEIFPDGKDPYHLIPYLSHCDIGAASAIQFHSGWSEKKLMTSLTLLRLDTEKMPSSFYQHSLIDIWSYSDRILSKPFYYSPPLCMPYSFSSNIIEPKNIPISIRKPTKKSKQFFENLGFNVKEILESESYYYLPIPDPKKSLVRCIHEYQGGVCTATIFYGDKKAVTIVYHYGITTPFIVVQKEGDFDATHSTDVPSKEATWSLYKEAFYKANLKNRNHLDRMQKAGDRLLYRISLFSQTPPRPKNKEKDSTRCLMM